MPAKESADVIFEQGRKLDFLIRYWGDQRKADPKRSNHVLQADEDGQIRSVRRVDNQEHLADAILEDGSRISAWKNDRARIPPEALHRICRIYAIEASAFRTLPYAEFVAVVRTGLQWPAWSRWRRLLDTPTPPGLSQTTRDPAGSWVAAAEGADLRHAFVPGNTAKPTLPEVAAETSFWLALSSPPAGPDDEGWAWAGWHLLILSRDCRTDGFADLSAAVSASGRFPADRTLYLPTGQGLQHDAEDLGAFQIVAVVAREPFPAEIVAGLSVGDGRGLLIEPALHSLATWIEGAREQVALRSLRYHVVAA